MDTTTTGNTPQGTQGEALVLVLTPEGEALSLTPAARSLYGLSEEESGRSVSELLRGGADPLPWADRLRSLPWTGLEPHTTPTGRRVWVVARLARRPDGQVELSARPAAGREILAARGALWSTLSDALAAGGIGAWIDDRVTNTLEWSPHMRRLFGVPQDATITYELMFSRIHPEDAERLTADIQRQIVDRRAPFSFLFRVGSEAEGWRGVESFGLSPHDTDGTLLGGIGCLREAEHVGRVAALEERIKLLEQQLRQAQKMDVVGRLAGGIAHDFNNLLTVVLGSAQLLQARGVRPDQRRELVEIHDAVRRAAELTQQLLAFGRKQALQRQVVRFDDAVHDASRLLKRVVGEQVTTSLEPDAGDWRVFLDPVHLHQVLANLLVNAAQAMGPEGGAVTVSTSQETLEAEGRSGAYVCLSVSDTGPGVPPEIASMVFDPFFTTKPTGSGTGLGLSTVQGIVEQHGGFIEIESPPGEGATFRVYLPRTDQRPDPVVRPAAAPQQPGGGEVILLAEDEPLVRVVTQRILESAGYQVRAAEDGAAALALAREGTPDLLLTDLVMPSLTGTSLVRELRKQDPNLTVLYMSGYPQDLVDSRVSLQAGDQLLRKPFTSEQLLASVQRALKSR